MLHQKSSRILKVIGTLCFITFFVSCSGQPEPYVNEVSQAREMLEQQRSEVQTQLEEEVTPQRIESLIELGLWEEAAGYLEAAGNDEAYKLAEAQLLMKQHHYGDAEALVGDVLENNPGNRDAQLLQAELDIQAWRLDEADQVGAGLMEENSNDAEASLIRGKVALLNRDYDRAVEWAQTTQDADPNFAGGYLLEAESRFWAQDPEGAEPALIRALELNPFNPDARFSYGYAIWRRVDATQLDNMAAQWNLAFEVNPRHYLAHWHFGNGHTNLTYADYAHPSDSTVRARLGEADALIPQNRLDEAIEITREVESEFPESVLPAMMRGSIYYMYYDMDRDVRLDSAETIFNDILQRKQNYGPAHNGLAAVIKQRQFEYLDGFEELQQNVEQTEIPDEGSVFYDIFKDADYYPGERVKKMIAQQIGPSKAYLPLIAKFDSDFAIPPLHIDLAEAMGSSYFRYGTTFDNRQWMDIRGVGSGATGIEYLERGAHWERNVLAHEYAHLYHGRILTDRENRRIRALYHSAMENNRTLDYYASNNESEFFAQGYAGFLSEKKVHPLNHKSMNTREYIQQKDPAYYAFLDSLLQKQQEYLAGNEEVFDDNWAQAYLTLAERSMDDESLDNARNHLDTALSYSDDYVPALLQYAIVEAREGNFEAAGERVSEAADLQEGYAPLYVTRANIVHQRALQDEVGFEESIKEQSGLLEQAYEMESDLSERARTNRLYRQRLEDYGRIAEAIEVAQTYLQNAPTISTYLRDRKEDTEAYYRYLRSTLGYSDEVTAFFRDLVDQNPQNFTLRRMYADVLMANDPAAALEVLEEGQRILASADNERSDYTLRMALIHVKDGEVAAVEESVGTLDIEDLDFEEKLLLARIHSEMGKMEEASGLLNETSEPDLPKAKADLAFVKGLIAEASGEQESATEHYRDALEHNAYHLEARAALINVLEAEGDSEAAKQLRNEAEELAIPLGPDFDQLAG
ncbi:MAG: tetratricopeptide repeat protein [Bacteroidetes bacterium]|jgi:lipopolysaccharide biosynthesis regulator YciM|nr:tetratricopeptide repeat protein [Bacteroidota bacterium]